jgi:hypothetical protein
MMKHVDDPKDPTSQELVTEFHETFGHPINVSDFGEKWYSLIKFRSKLIDEEHNELNTELWNTSQTGVISPNLLKEIADLRYVISGLCVALGIDEEECVRRVHESNMSKLGEDGKPIYREDGKVLKGPNYKEPDLTDLVPNHG